MTTMPAPRLLRFCSLAAAFGLFAACAPKTAPPPAPPKAEEPPPEVAEPEPEPEPEDTGPARRVGEDAIAVGTFNLQWAHDDIGEEPKLAAQNRAKTPEDWSWKVEHVAKLLVEEKLDIVAVMELGGSSEITDITMKVDELGGGWYDHAFVEGTDKRAGHQVAILSRFPITNQRRFDIFLRRHVAADIELPNGDTVTVVAVHAPEGKRSKSQRTKQLKALRREVAKLQKEQPVIVLGTLETPTLPDDAGYKSSSAGLLAGANTKKDADDCLDSASFYSAQSTTVHGVLADRMFVCGSEVEDIELSGEDLIVREERDPADNPWSAVPIDAAPFRDVSDHLVLWAEISLPKPPPEEKPEGEGEGEGGGSGDEVAAAP